MPKINNKGIGFIPLVIFISSIGLLTVFFYNFNSNKDKVLSYFRSNSESNVEINYLAQNNINDANTNSGKEPLYASIKFLPSKSLNPPSKYTGNLVITFTTAKETSMTSLINSIRKDGLTVESYCYTLNCSKPRIIRPQVKKNVSPMNSQGEIVIPVNAQTKSITFDFKNIPDIREDIDFEPLGQINWDLLHKKNTTSFTIFRKNEEAVIDVNLSSKTSTSRVYEFKINTVSDSAAELIRLIRNSSLTRSDLTIIYPRTPVDCDPSGCPEYIKTSVKDTVIKPAISYNANYGFVTFRISSVYKDTNYEKKRVNALRFNIIEDQFLKNNPIKFGNLPDEDFNWKVNSNGTGIER